MAGQYVSNDVKTSLGPVGLDRMLTNDILGDIDAATVLRMLRRWGVKEPATNVFDITRNPVTACQAASNDVKTSLGPVGLDPMLTNDILGDIDAATVLRMLRRWGVKEPATNVFDITRNPVTACQAASNDVKTSLGPVGLDPMLTNDILGDIDAATVLRMLRRWGVKEPATNVFDITRNPVTACQAASNDVKTSLGPVGLDPMLTNDILGDIDAATVLRMLRRWGVKEPATNVFDITRNPVTACQAASNDVKTSLGPVGLDPMLTNDILGDIDAATVLRMLRRWGVKEPATNVFDITRNPVTACQAASNDVKTSLGPVGLDPMLTNDILGDIDAATVLRMLRRWGVKEPATNVFDITRNPVTACQAASNDVKTSLGPVGLDPMLTNDILGDIDAATVLRMLRRWGVKEPATNVFDITRNPVTACQAASNDVKTSLGPVGLDPMLMDDIGEMTITTDAATILRMFRRWGVKHPATKNRPEEGCEEKCLSKLKTQES